MKTSEGLAIATLVGMVIGALGVEATRAQSSAPALLVAEFEVTDPVGWKTYVDGARANPSGGRISRSCTKGHIARW